MHEPATYTYDQISVGQSVQFDVEITEALVKQFAEISGDTNPLHMDQAYAATTSFGGRIAHGLLSASFFSQLVGMHLPGKNALYLSQQLLFREPVHIGTRVTVCGTVVQKIDAARTIKIQTTVSDASARVCIDGEALVKLLA